MSDSYYAPKGTTNAEQQRILPEFMVKKMDGTVKHTVYAYEQRTTTVNGKDRTINRRVEKVIERDAGWMVYNPRGSSIRVWSEDQLEKWGFNRRPGLVDMETGDAVNLPAVPDLEAIEQATIQSRRMKAR